SEIGDDCQDPGASAIAQRARGAAAPPAAALRAQGRPPGQIANCGGFAPGPVEQYPPDRHRTFIAGRHSAGSRRTDRRLARYRVGAVGRISHLKRRYGAKRSRLILTYNLAIRTA
ncbi:MAG: hypothetical protein M3442_07400, partial [Chloroflexota bacterium]|nr:hypothetical protein [Chloroflexota bacterium]